jgi:adenine C2-methylase RlmN of 23S rRNA A2503 and tRNA A37
VTFSTLISGEDQSVNHVVPADDGGAFECRFVRRCDAYFIVYLSSHSGCDRACRMCHLTQTGQTMMTPATFADYMAQGEKVMGHWFKDGDWKNVPEFVNFNFMARGEPFANENLLGGLMPSKPFSTGPLMIYALEERLARRAWKIGIRRAQFNYSTIMPASMPDRPLEQLIGRSHRDRNIYYSLYSLKPEFRRRWLPKAMDPYRALDRLAEYQKTALDLGAGPTPGEVVLHWSFIKGQNDDDDTVDAIIDAVLERGLKTRFNCVRYNPYSPAQGEEPDEETLERLTGKLAQAFGDSRTRIVPRVGFDVKASCGMFLAPAEVAALKES